MFATTQNTKIGHVTEELDSIPARLDEMAAGPILGAFLASIDVNRLNMSDRVTVLKATDRMVSHHQAKRIEAINAVVESYAEDLDLPRIEAVEATAFELRAALVMTRRASDRDVLLAHSLATRIPRVAELLLMGDLDIARVRVIDRCTDHLSAASAADVVERLGESISTLTTGELAARIRALCIHANPQDAKDRYERSVDNRWIGMQADPNGTARISAEGVPAETATAAMQHINHLARSLRVNGENRTMDQLRTDIAIDLLAGRTVGGTGSGGRQGSLEIRADIETLTALTDHPGYLNGYGPVIGDVARQVADGMHDAEWRWTITEHESDRPILSGTTRKRPNTRARSASTAQRRAITTRDTTCVFPGCRMPASGCDVDHISPYAEDGETTTDNMAALCTHDHLRAKHDLGWSYRRTASGNYRWRSPSGHIYLGGDPPRDW